MTAPLLEVRDLNKTYRVGRNEVRALQAVNLEVNRGETLAVVGESGSGKTTLANLLLGVEAATEGEVRFQGAPLGIRRDRGLQRAIQFVQQNPMTTLNPKRSIAQSVGLALGVHRLLPPRERRAYLADLLTTVGLAPEYLDRYPTQLSGGQRQRVAIARALAARPDVLVLDEPTSALDVSVQAKVLSLMLDLRERFNLTYVFITHDLSVVRNVSTHVAVMHRGRLVEYGATAELFRHPAHPYTRMLLSSIPVVSEAEEALKPHWDWNTPLPITYSERGCVLRGLFPTVHGPCGQAPAMHQLAPDHLVACHHPD